MKHIILGICIGLAIALLVLFHTADLSVSQKVDSRWEGGPDTWATSLDYMSLHPVCRDALASYVLTNPKTVAYMCNMVGDTWVTDLMKENTP